VIWTDVVQMFLYVGGAVLSFFVILGKIPGGWDHVSTVIGDLGKFQVFDFRFSLTPEFFSRSYSFWAGLIGGAFVTTASHGTEQLMVQRLLAAKTLQESRLALFSSWIVNLLPVPSVPHHRRHPVRVLQGHGTAGAEPSDRIYPAFIWNNLHPGVAGLVIAAILAAAMSNLSAALNALASTTIMDFYKPIMTARGAERSEEYFLKLARYSTLVWGAVLFGIGLIARSWGSVLEAGLSIASILYGGLLGVFLLGLLTKRVGENAAIAGMIAGLLVMFYVKVYTHIAFTWYVFIGTSITISVGYLASFIVKERVETRHA